MFVTYLLKKPQGPAVLWDVLVLLDLLLVIDDTYFLLKGEKTLLWTCFKRSNNKLLVIGADLLVFEVDLLGSDATSAGLELPRPLLQNTEFFLSEGGRRTRRVFSTLHGIRALKGIVVHHLVLPLWGNTLSEMFNM